jgi:hypothetical protein
MVVRDLWMRSRLPKSELETIWNLVVASEPGKPSPPAQSSLNKEQFVVGLWLIDQRLKGRKLPIRVSETVWGSVKGLQGIKVKKFMGCGPVLFIRCDRNWRAIIFPVHISLSFSLSLWVLQRSD